VQTSAPKQVVDLDAAVTAALEAAADRVSERVKGMLLTARLAATLHMCRTAEPVAAWIGHDRTSGSLSPAAAPAEVPAAAGLMRPGGRS
jgi:hypothetical protein